MILFIVLLFKVFVVINYDVIVVNLVVVNIFFFLISIGIMIFFLVRVVLLFDIYKIIKFEVERMNIDNLIVYLKLYLFVLGVEVEKECERYFLYVLLDLVISKGKEEIYVFRVIFCCVIVRFIDIFREVFFLCKSLKFINYLGFSGGYWRM